MNQYFHPFATDNFDAEFERITTEILKYYPWVGRNWQSSREKPLYVGESVYNWEGMNDSLNAEDKVTKGKEFLRVVIKEHGLHFTCDWPENSDEKGVPAKDRKMIDNLTRAIMNSKYPTNSEKEMVWTNAAFTELIQEPLSSINDRSTINKETINHGFEALLQTIKTLEPNYIVFIGSSNLVHVNSDCLKSLNNYKRVGRYWSKTGVIQIEGLNIPLLAIKHTSKFFSWDQWALLIKEWKINQGLSLKL
jgi:hypothetical protein